MDKNDYISGRCFCVDVLTGAKLEGDNMEAEASASATLECPQVMIGSILLGIAIELN